MTNDPETNEKLMLLNFNGVTFDLSNKIANDYVYNLFVSEVKAHRIYFRPNVADIIVGLLDQYPVSHRPLLQLLSAILQSAKGESEVPLRSL